MGRWQKKIDINIQGWWKIWGRKIANLKLLLFLKLGINIYE
jgi:hypothetical protein